MRLYKALHRTVQRVFRGDRAAMFATRDKVTLFECYIVCASLSERIAEFRH